MMRKFLPFLLALGLTTWLAWHSGITVDEVAASLGQVHLLALAGIFLSTGLFLALSTLKWRMVMAHLSPDDAHHHGWSYGFYHTALGAFLSLVLLPQVAMVVARGYGDKVRLGKSPAATAGATLYEQLFDIVPLLAFAGTALLAQLLDWSAGAWLSATMAVAIALGPLIALILRMRFWLLVGYLPGSLRNRLAPRLQWFAGPSAQALVEPRFALEVYAISVVRYFVLMIRTYFVFASLQPSFNDYSYGLAYSIVAASRLFFVTPGGLGIAEWSWSGVLTWLGMPLQESVSFVLANRLFNSLSVLLIFVLAYCAFVFRRMRDRKADLKGS